MNVSGQVLFATKSLHLLRRAAPDPGADLPGHPPAAAQQHDDRPVARRTSGGSAGEAALRVGERAVRRHQSSAIRSSSAPSASGHTGPLVVTAKRLQRVVVPPEQPRGLEAPGAHRPKKFSEGWSSWRQHDGPDECRQNGGRANHPALWPWRPARGYNWTQRAAATSRV